MAADYANTVTQRHNSVNGTFFEECYTCSNSGTTSVTCTEAAIPISAVAMFYRLKQSGDTPHEWNTV